MSVMQSCARVPLLPREKISNPGGRAMNLVDEMAQVAQSIDDGRVLYRMLQLMKREGEVDQQAVSETLDDVDALVRHFAVLRIRAEAEVHGVELSEAIENEAANRARGRLLETATRVRVTA